MHRFGVIVAAAVLATAQISFAAAATRKKEQNPPVMRTAAGTIIQPTKTIIHHEDGTTTVIVIPRRRSYLDTGTEVSPGDRSFMDYMLPPNGDPGEPTWWFGPDPTGSRGYPSPPGMTIPGFNPNTPF